MTQFFGEFLVQKELITEEQLIDALILQMKACPSTAELVKSEMLLSSSELLGVFKKQYTDSCDFISAYRSLGFYNKEVEANIAKSMTKIRRPLGQILVEKNIMKFNELAKCLDEYLASQKKQDSTLESAGSGAKVSSLNKLDQEAHEELTKFFSEDKFNSFMNSIEFLKNRATSDPILISEISSNLSTQLLEAKTLLSVYELTDAVNLMDKVLLVLDEIQACEDDKIEVLVTAGTKKIRWIQSYISLRLDLETSEEELLQAYEKMIKEWG